MNGGRMMSLLCWSSHSLRMAGSGLQRANCVERVGHVPVELVLLTSESGPLSSTQQDYLHLL